MKEYNKIWALALIPMLASCADDFDTTSNFQVDKPESVAQYEYLNAYAPLKSYIDRAAHPGFLLGTGVNADEYLQRGGVFVLTNTNFDQVTTGNAMKYASVVGDDGAMNFSKVMDFVDAATAAGLQVYGHTLCWHSQQNVTWLNSLIADKDMDPSEIGTETVVLTSYYDGGGKTIGGWGGGTMENVDEDGKPCFKFTNAEEKANPWDIQACISADFTEGTQYTMEFDVKGDPASFTWDFQKSDGYAGRGSTDAFDVKAAWTHVKINGTPNGEGTDRLLLSLGKYIGTLYITDVKITYEKLKETEIEVEEERRAIEVSSDDMVSAAWDTQFWIMTDATFKEGDSWEVSMDIRADKAAGSSTQVHTNAGDYLHYEGIGNPRFTRSWTTYTAKGNFPAGANGGHSIAFNLNEFAEANNYYFDNISFKVNGVELIKNSSCDDDNMKDNFIAKEKRGEPGPARFVDKVKNVISTTKKPLTAEEKAEILTNEMERWVKGMMEATEGKVKAWDVVNEPLADGGSDASGKRGLKTDNDVDNSAFLWQKYLGENYVRVPIKFARQYFVENGGNADELKLFINDYNLEAAYDNNFKAESLVKWVEQWESDGVTKIDGIGTQMHVSCSVDPAQQKINEDHVVRMFEILAKSGKLIRVTELDMGIVGTDGKAIKTPDLTFEQKKLMSDYYKFIVKKYFEIIPVAQQYGICAWAQTDSPEGSGWRAGEPIGLWDADYSRKPAYGGFADGLAGKE